MEKNLNSRILFCNCAYATILVPQTKQAVFQALKASGLPFMVVPDLCELAAQKASMMIELADADHLTIAACHARAVKWLFAAAGASLQDERVEHLDMRASSVEKLLHTISGLAKNEGTLHDEIRFPALSDADASAENSPGENADDPKWKPWFPVIDYARCVHCRQCLGFCLFGVYSADSYGKVQVTNPTGCKADCPACARVCPETAIIFPKYPFPPINGGEGHESVDLPQPIKLDRAAMVQGDILKVLQERGKSTARFALNAERAKALQERLLRLSKAQKPDGVPLSTHPKQPPTMKEPE
jgi:Pyruvate/2-oxoacid:ferredoxin oxidoreductase delta subunit